MSTDNSGSTDGERWLPVVGYEGMYEVSDQGRVRSLDRVDAIGRRCRGRLRATPPAGRRGYPRVSLTVSGRNRYAYVHDLVAMAFIGPKPDGQVTRHRNDVATDNRVENLQYGTQAENLADARRNGGIGQATECKRGHEFTPENSKVLKSSPGWRTCRACVGAEQRMSKSSVPEGITFDEVADAQYRKILAGDRRRIGTRRMLLEYGGKSETE